MIFLNFVIADLPSQVLLRPELTVYGYTLVDAPMKLLSYEEEVLE